MNNPDRTEHLKALKTRLTGIDISGPNVPSWALCDRMATILKNGAVRYIPWDKCTSRDQELMEEPEVKGLRLTADGTLTQDLMPQSTTDLSSAFFSGTSRSDAGRQPSTSPA